MDYIYEIFAAADAFVNSTGRRPCTVYLARGERAALGDVVKIDVGYGLMDIITDLRLKPETLRVDDVPAAGGCA